MKKLLLSLILILLTACSTASVKTKKISFENIQWKLVSFGNKGRAVPQKAWIRFKEGRYSGYAGCNGMGGEYRVNKKQLELKSGMSTLMACADMSLETRFRQEMQKVTSYAYTNKELVLMHNDQAILNFREASFE